LNKRERRAALIAVLLAIVAAAIAGVNLLLSSSTPKVNTSNSFIAQPVLDIIVPSLFHESSTGGVNAPLNASRGQTLSLTVQLFPTTNLNVSMQFRYFILNGSATQTSSSKENPEYLSAVFYPSETKLTAGRTTNVTMQLVVSSSATIGQYNSVLSAENVQNSSQIWGVIMQVNVAK
jgi:hypothetical protein